MASKLLDAPIGTLSAAQTDQVIEEATVKEITQAVRALKAQAPDHVAVRASLSALVDVLVAAGMIEMADYQKACFRWLHRVPQMDKQAEKINPPKSSLKSQSVEPFEPPPTLPTYQEETNEPEPDI